MIEFKELLLCNLQKFIGKEIYIIHPGNGSDPYWGTIDSEPPHLLHKVIDSFCISKLGIEVVVCKENYCEKYNIEKWKMFFDEKSARRELEKMT